MSVLFQPVTIGTLQLRNRFVRSATQDYLGHPDGTISKPEIRSLPGAVGGRGRPDPHGPRLCPAPPGGASLNQNAIYADRFIAGYGRLAEAVHADGAALVLQVSHAGRQTPPDWPAALESVAPSAIPDGSTGRTPRALTEEEIWSLVDAYAAAMGRAQAAGCDGVQLHVAHGYLLSAFLSPYTNRRTDAWGGSVTNRCRILKEILARGRQLVGATNPVLVKLNTTDGIDGPGTLTLPEAVIIARHLVAWGVDAIEVSGGHREFKGVMSRPRATGAIRRTRPTLPPPPGR